MKRLSNVFLLLLVLLISVAVTEAGLRIFLEDRLHIKQDANDPAYRHDSELGWFPISNSTAVTRDRPIHIRHNSRGFRDEEHVLGTNPRILFVGDSFVWGYAVEQADRFTDKLKARLPGWSVFNLGVSGYGTDQEYLLLQQQLDYYNPDVVFLTFCTNNDEIDNSRNRRYGGYYKPYFTADGEELILRGTPVPESVNYFFSRHPTLRRSYTIRLIAKAYFKLTNPSFREVKNPTREILTLMNDYVQSKGSTFLVGLQDRHPALQRFFEEANIPYVDLSAANEFTFPTDGNHWTPAGHTMVSEFVYDFLVDGNHLETMSVEN